MTERPATLSDALYLLEAHERSGCLWLAVDYAERTRSADRETLKRGVAYVTDGLKRRRDEMKEKQ